MPLSFLVPCASYSSGSVFRFRHDDPGTRSSALMGSPPLTRKILNTLDTVHRVLFEWHFCPFAFDPDYRTSLTGGLQHGEIICTYRSFLRPAGISDVEVGGLPATLQ